LQKVENRAWKIHDGMNVLNQSLDNLAIQLNNSTRIQDIKNTVYCENLIAEEESVNDCKQENLEKVKN
jgi:hypothetical protein